MKKRLHLASLVRDLNQLRRYVKVIYYNYVPYLEVKSFFRVKAKITKTSPDICVMSDSNYIYLKLELINDYIGKYRTDR